MKPIHLIAAVDVQGGIGYENKLLFHLKGDMEFFKQKTQHNIVIMGRKTQESLPGEMPLSERKNIVLTRQRTRWDTLREKGFYVVHCREQALELAEELPGKVYVIGGANIYKEFLPLASVVYLTRIQQCKQADAYFPQLSKEDGWQCVFNSRKYREGDITFYMEEFRRTSYGTPVENLTINT